MCGAGVHFDIKPETKTLSGREKVRRMDLALRSARTEEVFAAYVAAVKKEESETFQELTSDPTTCQNCGQNWTEHKGGECPSKGRDKC